MGGIVLLNCNTGHFDRRYSSFANKMLIKNNTNFVVASDGTVGGKKQGIVNRTMTYRSDDDKYFVGYLWSREKYRSKFGFIKYTKNSAGELEWSILGKGLSVTQMH